MATVFEGTNPYGKVSPSRSSVTRTPTFPPHPVGTTDGRPFFVLRGVPSSPQTASQDDTPRRRTGRAALTVLLDGTSGRTPPTGWLRGRIISAPTVPPHPVGTTDGRPQRVKKPFDTLSRLLMRVAEFAFSRRSYTGVCDRRWRRASNARRHRCNGAKRSG